MDTTGFVEIQGKELCHRIYLLQLGRLELVAWVHVQTGFEHLGGWRLYNLLGQLMPVPGHSVKKYFLMFRVCQFVPIASSAVNQTGFVNALLAPFVFLTDLEEVECLKNMQDESYSFRNSLNIRGLTLILRSATLPRFEKV